MEYISLIPATALGYLTLKVTSHPDSKIRRKLPDSAEDIITEIRGSFEPENSDLNSNNQEEEANDYTEQELIDKTNDLINRKWAEIDLFLTEEDHKYPNSHKLKTSNLNGFLYECMKDSNLRPLVESFFKRYALDKYE